ncbi:hypothetical protein JY97_12000 [Alkalispirochaeta odontotermitis]|nr:hypothetical protein JY97_12000 [Alkalispirochaeta odontotermitis]CAB1077495.1 hypothetical protein D1AOALGA4SA_5282 [Olavius algarvensis Delta 1 endosymbiont]
MFDAFHVTEKPGRVFVPIDCNTQSKLIDIFSQTIVFKKLYNTSFNIYFIDFQIVNLVRRS